MRNVYKIVGLAAVTALVSVSALAQGQIGVINYVGSANPNNAIVTDMFGSSTAIAGSTYLVDLLYGTSAGSINQDAGIALTFHTGAGAGYWNPVNLTLPGGYNGSLYFQAVVWQAAAGASWIAATGGGVFNNSALSAAYLGHGGSQYGASSIFNLTINSSSPTSTAQGAGTLQAFGLVAPLAVPEPGTLALAAMGGASLLLFRRRK